MIFIALIVLTLFFAVVDHKKTKDAIYKNRYCGKIQRQRWNSDFDKIQKLQKKNYVR